MSEIDVREKMENYRKEHLLTFDKLSRKCRVSAYLLSQVEKGWVTHPKLAKRIGKVYGLSEEETYELMPEIHRPGHPRYDPDHYKSAVDRDEDTYKFFKIPPRREDIDGLYILDSQYRMGGHYHKRKGMF